jgi:hypothetical protein
MRIILVLIFAYLMLSILACFDRGCALSRAAAPPRPVNIPKELHDTNPR